MVRTITTRLLLHYRLPRTKCVQQIAADTVHTKMDFGADTQVPQHIYEYIYIVCLSCFFCAPLKYSPYAPRTSHPRHCDDRNLDTHQSEVVLLFPLPLPMCRFARNRDRNGPRRDFINRDSTRGRLWFSISDVFVFPHLKFPLALHRHFSHKRNLRLKYTRMQGRSVCSLLLYPDATP